MNRDAADEPIRLADILSNAAAIADYTGADFVTAGHVLQAIGILRGELTAAELGSARAPLGRRGPRAIVTPGVRDFAQSWYRRLGRDPSAPLSDERIDEAITELREIDAVERPPEDP